MASQSEGRTLSVTNSPYRTVDRAIALSSGMTVPIRLKQLEQSINEDLTKANLPEIRIDGFKLPDQALQLTFERETVTGVIRDKIWEIINGHYKRLMSELGLLDL